MESLTKNRQYENTIWAMVDKFFHPLELAAYRELTEGYFNVAYEITLDNGEAVILKISPSGDTRVMTYEKNIMFSEVEAMRMAAQHGGIPVPGVLGYDNSCMLCKSPYFFMEKLDGSSLNKIKDSLTQEQIENIYIETGKINREINRIECPCFGYPGQPEFQGTEWYPVFRKMVAAGLDDAYQGKVDLQIPADRLLSLLERDRECFDEVTKPRLVHWDCWDGNIFVLDGMITGIIDWERSLWADPLMEVGFRTYGDNAFFQKGYGIGRLTKAQLRRARWYDIYVLILVALECEYRKYETTDTYNWATRLLTEQFRKMDQ